MSSRTRNGATASSLRKKKVEMNAKSKSISTTGSGRGRPRRTPIHNANTNAPPSRIALPNNSSEQKEKEESANTTTTTVNMCAKWDRLGSLLSTSNSNSNGTNTDTDTGYKRPDSILGGHDAAALLSSRLMAELASERRAMNAVRNSEMKRARLAADKVRCDLRVDAHREAVRDITRHYSVLGSKDTARAYRSIPRGDVIHMAPEVHAHFAEMYTDFQHNNNNIYNIYRCEAMLQRRPALTPNTTVLDAKADDTTKRVEMLADYFEALQKASRQMKQIHEFHVEGDVDADFDGDREIDSDGERDGDSDSDVGEHFEGDFHINININSGGDLEADGVTRQVA